MTGRDRPCVDLRWTLLTGPSPGAIGILLLTGPVDGALRALTGLECPEPGQVRWTHFMDIDDGLVTATDPGSVLLMPHGGPRVIQRLVDALEALGARWQDAGEEPERCFPEAKDYTEACMLRALAEARSPLAIDLLLCQPKRWRDAAAPSQDDLARSRRLNHLIDPPRVVLVGPANVGKSTLTNTLHGRTVSIVTSMPGTTRDYTTGLLDLSGLVVQWHDTPGLRPTRDPVEQDAVRHARERILDADLLLAMTDSVNDWPHLPRAPDLKIGGRCDRGERDDADISVSGSTGDGVSALVDAIVQMLVPARDRDHPGPWRFDLTRAGWEPASEANHAVAAVDVKDLAGHPS